MASSKRPNFSSNGRWRSTKRRWVRNTRTWLGAFNNLALLYNDQRQYTKADAPHHQALAILNKTLGAEHPDVAICLYNYVTLLKKTGLSQDARQPRTRKGDRATHSAGDWEAH